MLDSKFSLYKKLHEIARTEHIALSSMAIIDDVNYYMCEQHGKGITQDEFQTCYEEILRIDNILEYDQIVQDLILLLEKK